MPNHHNGFQTEGSRVLAEKIVQKEDRPFEGSLLRQPFECDSSEVSFRLLKKLSMHSHCTQFSSKGVGFEWVELLEECVVDDLFFRAGESLNGKEHGWIRESLGEFLRGLHEGAVDESFERWH